MQTRCPGQDTRFWQPGDVFEVACAECGYGVEFFKDDAVRRCRSCGARVSNPRLNLGCALWCEHAKECLGYDPKERQAQAGAADEALIDRLLAVVKRELGPDQEAFGRAVAVMEQAQRLLAEQGGRPKVVLAAALLLSLDPDQTGRGEGAPLKAAGIMDELGLDQDTREAVLGIIRDFHQNRAGAEPELGLVVQAARSAAAEPPSGSIGPGQEARG
jgi:hypothetical protein